MIEFISAVALGAAGSLAATFMLWQMESGRQLLEKLFRTPFGIGATLAEGGITRMTLSRSDYHKLRIGSGTLREYLSTAEHKIELVSVSLNVTQAEGALISLFRQRLHENENFVVRVTLFDPESPLISALAKSLDISSMQLENEILNTLEQLVTCKEGMPENERGRLLIYTHESVPIGSAILLDASPDRAAPFGTKTR